MDRTARHTSRSFSKQLFLLSCLMGVSANVLITTMALAAPEGGVVSAGQASISTAGSKTNIHQGSQRAVIDWRSFNVGQGEHVQFYQPNSGAIALNRIGDVNPSTISGQLTANGNIVLVNPNGVVFNQGSRVDVNGMIASTAGISNNSFMNGSRLHFDQAGNSGASIINNGTITAKQAGLVGFIAPNVINNGIITANMGRVHLGAGDTATVDFYGDGLIEVAVKDDTQNTLARNTGLISADGGTVAMTAATGKGIVSNLIDAGGEIKALSVGQKDGKIILSAEKSRTGTPAAMTTVSGTLDASGKNTGETGGQIDAFGDMVVVKSGATIDASGDTGGGWVRVGGDYQGTGDAPTAKNTFIEKNARINVDAIRAGDGGRAIIWADNNTYYYGDVTARGGAQSGDGGFVEVSGKEYLVYKGNVDTRAENGETGLLLLDPTDIFIANGTADSAADGTGTFAGTPSGVAGTIAGADTGPMIIYESELEGIAAGTNISLTATNSITIADLTNDGTLNFAQNAGRSVSFSAGNGGITMQNLGNTLATAGGAFNFTTSGTGGVTLGHLAANNGAVTFNVGGNSLVAGDISGATTTVTKSGTGLLSLNGNNTYNGNTTLNAGTLQIGSNTALGGGLLIFAGGTLQGDGTPRALPNNVQVSGATATFGGTSNLSMNSLENIFAGNIALNNAGTGLISIGDMYLSNSATTRTATFGGTGNMAVTGSIYNGGTAVSGNITKTGTGRLTLSGNNFYSGTTTVTAGTLRAEGNAGALGTGIVSLGAAILELAGDVGINFGRNVTLTGNGTVQSDRSTAGAGVTHQLGTLSMANQTLSSAAGTNVSSGIAAVHFGNTTFTNNPVFTNGANSQIGFGALSNGGVNRTITKNGAGSIIFNAAPATWATTGNSLVINNGAALLGATDALGTSNNTAITVNSTAAGGTALFDLNGYNQTVASLTLGGAGATATSINNVATGAGTLTLGGNVTFTNTNNPLGSTISGNLNLGGATRTFTINDSTNSTRDVVIDAVISGAVGLTKAGTGTLVLSGNNTYSGTTTLSAGTLRAENNANALGAGMLSLGGGTLALAGDTPINFARNTLLTANTTIQSDRDTAGAGVTHQLGTLSMGGNTLTASAGTNVTSGTGSINFGNTSLTGNPTFSVLTAAQLGIGALSNGGTNRTVTKTGAGILAFNNAAAAWTTTGNSLVVNQGTARLNATNALGTGANTAITVNSTVAANTALFDLNNFNQTITTLTFGGAGASATGTNNVSTGTGLLTLGGDITYTNTNNPLNATLSGLLDLGGATRTFTINNSTGAPYDLSITADISGAGGINKAGAGTLRLTGNNSYTGITNLTTGTLRAEGNANALGVGTLTLAGGTLELAGDTGINFGRNTTVTANTTVVSDRITAGAGVTHQLGTLLLGNQTFTTNRGANATSGIGAVHYGATTLGGGPAFTVGANAEMGVGALSNGGANRAITKNGLGSLLFSAAAGTWATTGNTLTINNGTAYLGASNALGTGGNTAVTVNANVAGQTALFDLNGYNQTVASLTFGGGGGTATSTNNVDTGTGTLTLGGNVTYTNTGNPLGATLAGNVNLGGATRTFTINDSTSTANELHVTANISGGAGLTKAGAGTLTLAGNNTYTGTTTVNAGTLALTGGNAIANTGIVTLANVAGVNLVLNNNEEIGQLTGGGALGGNTNINGNILSVGDAGSFSYTGVISGTGTLRKIGTGVMTLLGANTYTGTTDIQDGTLTLGAADRIADASDIFVATGATLNLNSFNETVASIFSNGLVTYGSGNSLTTSGGQAYNGQVTGNNNNINSGGGLFATNALNDFTGTLTASALGTLEIADANSLTLGIISANTVLLRALGGNITTAGQIIVGAGTGTGAILTTSGNFNNTFGAGLFNTGGSNWNVYSTDPALDNRNGLTPDFKQYDAVYGDTVLGTGNGFLYSIAPTVSTTLTGTATKTYDGTLAATLGGGNYGAVTGAIDGDTVTLTTPAAGTYDTANAGTGKTVTVNGVTVASATNGAIAIYGYQVGSGGSFSGSIGTINAANITLSTSDITKTYDGTLAAAGAAVVTSGTLFTNVSNGNTLDTLSGGTFAFADANAGTGKTVNVSGITINDGNGGNNYNITYADNTNSTINAANITISTADVTKTYNGLVAAAGSAIITSGTLFTNASNGNTLDSISGGTFAFADANAGTGKTVNVSGVTVNDGNGGGNYNVTYAANTNSTINQANLTISTADVTRTYDGTLAAAGTAVVTAGTLYTNESNGNTLDSLSGGIFGFVDANAGTGKTVTVSGVTVNDGNAGGNYNVTYADNTNSTINAANITLSTSDVTKTYDGTLAAAGAAIVTSGTLFTNVSNGNTLDSLSGGTFAFANANAGMGKIVNVSGITINDGNGGNNYNITYADNTNSTINQANLTLTAQNQTKQQGNIFTFNGTEFTVGGTLYGTDSITGATLASLGAGAGATSAGSPYAITASNATGSGVSNYNISYIDGVMTVTPAPANNNGVPDTVLDKSFNDKFVDGQNVAYDPVRKVYRGIEDEGFSIKEMKDIKSVMNCRQGAGTPQKDPTTGEYDSDTISCKSK